MKKSVTLNGEGVFPVRKERTNGRAGAVAESDSPELALILERLQSMREGDFSVRLPGSWTGITGKIADSFNDIAMANQKIATELKHVGQVVGKEGRTRQRAKFNQSKGAWGEMEVSVNTLIEDLLRPTTEVTRAIAANCCLPGFRRRPRMREKDSLSWTSKTAERTILQADNKRQQCRAGKYPRADATSGSLTLPDQSKKQ